MEFDGTPNFVIVSHNDLFNFADGDFSMGCWMEAKKLDAYVVIKRNGGAFWAMSASIDRESGLFIFEGGGQHIDDGKTKIFKTGWHHCVVVRKKGEISLYVDGKLDTKRKGAANMDNAAFIRFGGWGSENHVGGLDEVFISKKARCYGSRHQYRLHNFKGCVAALVSDYNLTRQQASDVLKVCIQLHIDTPDTPN